MKGRLNRESNPLPGEKSGFTPQHEKADGSFVNTGEVNPHPVKITNQVEQPKDYPDNAVKAELESIKATQQAILDKLDGTINTQLTGSNVGYSTDDKTLIEAEKVDSFLELDTSNVFVYDGTKWVGI